MCVCVCENPWEARSRGNWLSREGGKADKRMCYLPVPASPDSLAGCLVPCTVSGLAVWRCSCSEPSFRREAGRIHPLDHPVLSSIVKVPFTEISFPHFWVLPPAQEAPGVGTSPGLLSPLLWSACLISLREHVFFVLSFHGALWLGGGTTITFCFRSGLGGWNGPRMLPTGDAVTFINMTNNLP